MNDQEYEQAYRIAAHWVQEAEKQALLVHVTPDGLNKRLEKETALSYMGIARGALSVLRVLWLDHPQVEELEHRLNHCPVLMMAGDGRGQQQLQLVK